MDYSRRRSSDHQSGPRAFVTGLFTREALLALTLAMLLPTRYRFSGGVGVGEVAVVGVGLALIFLALLRKRLSFVGVLGRLVVVFASYVLLILLPITLVGVYFDIPGVAFRDWLAYSLSAVFLLACAVGQVNLEAAVRYLITFVLALIGIQYFFGGDNAWYFSRFTAGASNPNQLALYVVCCSLLSIICLRSLWGRALILTIFVLIGMSTGSDALLASGLAASCAYLVCIMVPRRALILLSPLLISGSFLLWIEFGNDVGNLVSAEWSGADEGGARATLYINGLRAWLDTPFTALVGNGAGAFSGLVGPYGGAEAHNTPIDLLAIGSVSGFVVGYWAFLYLLARAYKRGDNTRVAVIVGLVVFSLFHFVARQPIWWFSLAVFAYVGAMGARTKDMN